MKLSVWHRIAIFTIAVAAVGLGLALTGGFVKPAVAAFRGTRPVRQPVARHTSTGPTAPVPSKVPPGPFRPNEAGQVMILMYHRFEPQPGAWNRTPADFRHDLETLYAKGYRLVSLSAVLNGQITLPAGYTPVVLTFDDGWKSQFNATQRGSQLVVDPDSAVGILEEFHRSHPDMALHGTFFLNDNPFAQPRLAAAKLARLVNDGFEIGNHTYTHPNLRKLNTNDVMKELGQEAALLKKLLPGNPPETMALPFGIFPHDHAAAHDGSFAGVAYHYRAVMLVGANPASSPFLKAFDPHNLPRVQGSTAELGKWLAYFDKHPEQRYVSDGDPRHVSVRQADQSSLNPAMLVGRRVRTVK